MTSLRPLFASLLLAVALAGGVLTPAAHWAGHALRGHVAPVEAAAGQTVVVPAPVAGHPGDCPGCAHLQTVHVTGPDAVPFYAAVVGLERSVPVPEDPPALNDDIAAPEGRGPPSRA